LEIDIVVKQSDTTTNNRASIEKRQKREAETTQCKIVFARDVVAVEARSVSMESRWKRKRVMTRFMEASGGLRREPIW